MEAYGCLVGGLTLGALVFLGLWVVMFYLKIGFGTDEKGEE